eukprot:398245_1
MASRHIDLTIFQYSTLVYDAFALSILEEERGEIMDLCFYLSFFVTNANQSIADYESLAYRTTLEQFMDPNIANIISSFIIEKSNYLKWTHFEEDKHDNQVRYSSNDNIVDFSHSSCDYVNAKTPLLSKTIYPKYFVNVYCLGKGDEMWLGLIKKSQYRPRCSARCHRSGLFYYGGREYSTKRYGGSPKDECHGWGSGHDDCNHGGIQGCRKVIQHPIESYSAGDWISFEIDMENKQMLFYKNGVLQYKAESEWFPDGDCYFMVELDDDIDKFYIEQGYNEQTMPWQPC